jgi:hypothetical protein
MLEKIQSKDILYAIIIRHSFTTHGIEFFTPPEFSQQLGYMQWGKGHIIQPHAHKNVQREVIKTQEVLFIKSGQVRVDFYDKNDERACHTILNSGDVILLADGGHGFEMLEASELIEVKQGPYAGDEDKRRFDVD